MARPKLLPEGTRPVAINLTPDIIDKVTEMSNTSGFNFSEWVREEFTKAFLLDDTTTAENALRLLEEKHQIVEKELSETQAQVTLLQEKDKQLFESMTKYGWEAIRKLKNKAITDGPISTPYWWNKYNTLMDESRTYKEFLKLWTAKRE